MPENIWHGCWSKLIQTKQRFYLGDHTSDKSPREKPFPHHCGSWEVQQYYQTWNCAPMTQKHKFLIVPVGLWGLLCNALTSFDQTAVQGSSGLQRGEDNPHKHRSSPLREPLQMPPLCSTDTRAIPAFTHATKEFALSGFLLSVHCQPDKGDTTTCAFFSDLSQHFNSIRLQWCSNVSRFKVSICWVKGGTRTTRTSKLWSDPRSNILPTTECIYAWEGNTLLYQILWCEEWCW